MMSALALQFSIAQPDEAERLVGFINNVYRGEDSALGWTTELGLLDEARTDLQQMKTLFSHETADILLCHVQGQWLGTVVMIKLEAYSQFCMLAVDPRLQNQGVGKALLQEAERYSAAKWGMQRFAMEVIGCRHELIAFYERRGYCLTGEKRGFPSFEPKALSLELLMMEKRLTESLS